jgi:uncharacterized protein (TIGR03435 family)
MMPVIKEALLAVSNSLAVLIVAKVTFITALGLIGAWLTRRNRAAVRYAILAAAFGVLLTLPVASIITLPVRVAVPAVAQDRAVLRLLDAANNGILFRAAADRRFSVTPRPQRSLRPSLSALLIMGWIAGTTLSLLPVIVGLWKIRSLRRAGFPWAGRQSIVEGLARDAGVRRRIEVLMHEASPGPMTYGLLHPAIILPLDAEGWEEEELNRAVVHELEHVRRGDWASQCLARAVCAVYWFHPLVWMAWRQLALEAERSCDDAVLRRSEATVYADQLVTLARRLSMAAKTPLLAMANRADLTARVGAVLDSRQPRGRVGAFPLALACAAAAVLVITLSPLRMVAEPQSVSAQNAPHSLPAAATPQFDAASVKLVDADVRGFRSSTHSDPERLAMVSTLHRFIIQAYDITDGQIGGEPVWFKTRLYSIDAVTSAPTGRAQMMLMLRSLLADRFQLRLRQENRQLPVYTLEVSAGGPKFKELKPGEDPPDDKSPPGMVARSFGSIKELMNALNGGGSLTQDRPVVDRTHLTGDYNIQLVTDIEAQTDDFGRRTVRFPNLFQDIQSQLGLKMAPDRVRMPYFVVEHAAEPTPN